MNTDKNMNTKETANIKETMITADTEKLIINFNRNKFIEFDEICINTDKIVYFTKNYIQLDNLKLPITEAQYQYLQGVLING